MAMWLQNLVVIVAVAGCVAFIAWQFVGTLFSRGKLGSCCAKGCSRTQAEAKGKAGEGDQRVVFLPAEFLTRRR